MWSWFWDGQCFVRARSNALAAIVTNRCVKVQAFVVIAPSAVRTGINTGATTTLRDALMHAAIRVNRQVGAHIGQHKVLASATTGFTGGFCCGKNRGNHRNIGQAFHARLDAGKCQTCQVGIETGLRALLHFFREEW